MAERRGRLCRRIEGLVDDGVQGAGRCRDELGEQDEHARHDEAPGDGPHVAPAGVRHDRRHGEQRQRLAGHRDAEQPARPAERPSPAPLDGERRPQHEGQRDAVLGVTPEHGGADDAQPGHDGEREAARRRSTPTAEPPHRGRTAPCTRGRRHGGEQEPEHLGAALGGGRPEPGGVTTSHDRRQEELEARRRVEIRRRGVHRGEVAVPDRRAPDRRCSTDRCRTAIRGAPPPARRTSTPHRRRRAAW